MSTLQLFLPLILSTYLIYHFSNAVLSTTCRKENSTANANSLEEQAKYFVVKYGIDTIKQYGKLVNQLEKYRNNRLFLSKKQAAEANHKYQTVSVKRFYLTVYLLSLLTAVPGDY